MCFRCYLSMRVLNKTYNLLRNRKKFPIKVKMVLPLTTRKQNCQWFSIYDFNFLATLHLRVQDQRAATFAPQSHKGSHNHTKLFIEIRLDDKARLFRCFGPLMLNSTRLAPNLETKRRDAARQSATELDRSAWAAMAVRVPRMSIFKTLSFIKRIPRRQPLKPNHNFIATIEE